MKADLHIHTKYSFDGEKEVRDIIDMALEKNLDFISITDHNEYLGSLKLVQSKRIRSITGIEIDCYDGEIIHHILGYGCNLHDTRFKTLKKHYRQELVNATQKRIEMFNELFSINLDLETIKNEYPNQIITNIEMTKHMFLNFQHDAFKPYISGNRKDNPLANFYWDYCALNKPAYVSLDLPDTKQIIDLIHDTKGVAIIAHPMIMNVPLSYYDQLVNIDGIEACCSYHSSTHIDQVLEYAKQRNILITCGSDYHGINKPNIEIAQHYEPFESSDDWLNKLLEKIG